MRVFPLVLLVSSASLASAAVDPRLDDFERFPYLWRTSRNVRLANPGGVLLLEGPVRVAIRLSGRLCRPGDVHVTAFGSPEFEARNAVLGSITLGKAHVSPKGAKLRDVDRDGRLDLVLRFAADETGLPCDAGTVRFNGRTADGRWFTAGGAFARAVHPFAASQDWSLTEGLRFRYFGHGTGDALAIELRDNRAPDPGPPGWSLVWRDEFSGEVGQPPDPTRWSHEVGDGTAQGIPGWGNNEREYYTDSAANAALDGRGHLAITARRADGSLRCYYGPCEYTSARLISQYKAEFAHGRIEARILVPRGAGLWPAFWSLGTNIGQAGWPGSGEIDIMEFVGRDPNRIFGTIHGPGYSGAQGRGGTFDFGVDVGAAFHTFAVEWQPGRIDWLADGVVYHTETAAGVAPNRWVFDHPFFLIMNFALGGYFPGPVGSEVTFPQTLLVDYVRVFQAPDTAERFEASFLDDFTGWQDVEIPFGAFARSARQREGAPDDGLGLTEVWGYGLALPDSGLAGEGTALVDEVRLLKPASVVVTTVADDGPGSLRRAIATVSDGGTITFDPSLAGATITLTSGSLSISGQTLTIDGSTARGLTLSGGGRDRIVIIDPGATANLSFLTFANGSAWDVAGGILNNGTLNLDHALVRDNVLNSNDEQWWKGGGGVFLGDGATLNLTNSTIRGNRTIRVDGGGLYARQGTTVHITNSTITGNIAGHVGGGIRMLGSATIVNSTISGNTSAAWYGSALFHTDGVTSIVNSTITANVAPPGADAAVFVGTFTGAKATLTLTNTLLGANGAAGCFFAPFGGGRVILASGGHNVFTDTTCAPRDSQAPPPPPPASDQAVADALLGPLDDNGGPTATHLLLPGSPAIDAADPAFCPATDQRGIARPQGPTCDVGAVEIAP